jgi:ABC-2 type transport system ATP-binding protein
MPAIDVSGLVVRYGAMTAVDGLDLRAEAGEVLALLGRNGAGKTSTVETIEGYRRPAAGTVRVLGLDPQRPDDHRRLTERVGVMLQTGGVYPAMSPREAVHLFASYYKHPQDPGALLDRLGLEGPVLTTPWRRLSGGEQQRLSLALALVGRPEVVFLDEPTAGVDPHGRLAIRAEVSALRDSGVCVMLTTHELTEAERLADRIVIIERGRVLAAGTPGELTAQSGGPSVRFGAPPGLDTAAMGRHLRAAVTEERPGEYRVAATGEPAMIAALAAWLADRDLPLSNLRAGSEPLEEVFLRLTATAPDPNTQSGAGAGAGEGHTSPEQGGGGPPGQAANEDTRPGPGTDQGDDRASGARWKGAP